ncbi:MAG: HEAT repeat domain-containing protein [Planctomycetes bacterium]|nr:HEAT repeat domain-containing protein [Planctomycetota bacterium]
MTLNTPRLLWTLIILQVAAVLLLLASLFRPAAEDEPVLGEEFDELVQELSALRYQLSDQGNRLTRLLDRLARGGPGPEAASAQPAGAEAPSEPGTPLELLEELARVTEVLGRYQYDPLQREPVEKERARLEDLLRRGGDDTIDALVAFFPEIPARYPEIANPTWFQTRILTHVVDQIGSDAAVELARAVFENTAINPGVRLSGAQIALKKHGDEITGKLIALLENPDPSFDRPIEIVKYFQGTVEPRAIPALIALATSIDTERNLRRFTLQALSRYDDPRVIDALKEVASSAVNGDLRAAAISALGDLLKKDILPFVRHLRENMPADDPLRTLLDNTESYWADAEGG